MSATGKNTRQGILSLTIRDKSSLYAAYMPFVKNGGLFIPTNKAYNLGDEVFMLLTLTDSKEKLPVAGRVVWAEIDREARKGKPTPSDHAPVLIDLDAPGEPLDAGWEDAGRRIAARRTR